MPSPQARPGFILLCGHVPIRTETAALALPRRLDMVFAGLGVYI
jgi:hypothetical protein